MIMPKRTTSGKNGNGKDVIKHSGAIHMSGGVSLLERKTWNVLLANAFNDLEQQETYEIKLGELAMLLRYNSNDHELLKESLRTLNHTQVEWNVLNKDKHIWAATTLLAGVEIINGVCRYGYSFVLREKLSDPAMYARLNLLQQSFFKKKYAHILWELFNDYFDEKKEYGETPWVTIKKFRKILSIKAGEYNQFKELNKLVIKKAIKEINEISDLYVDLKKGIIKRREGRKIGSIKFIIQRNEKSRIKVKMLEDFAGEAQRNLRIPKNEVENQQLFDTLMIEFGISKNKAVEILKTKDEFYIVEILKVVRTQIKAEKVKDIPAYTVKAIEDDYRRKKPKAEIEKGKKQAKKKQNKKEKELIVKLKAEFDEHFKSKTDLFLQDLDESKKDELIKEFENEYIANSNDIIKASYLKNGLESYMNLMMFHSHIAEQFLEEEDREFAKWMEIKGIKVRKDEKGEYKII